MTTHEPETIGAAARAAAMALRPRADEPGPRLSAVTEADAEQVAAAGMRDVRRDEWQLDVPGVFHTARLEDFTGRPFHGDLAGWANDDGPANLVLCGPVGVGKSHAAIAAARPRYGRGASIEFVPVVELLERLDWRRPDSHLALEHFCTVDVLLVDDLGTERANEWTGERLYLIVNRRWLERRPIIATTNYDLSDPAERDALEAAVGPRTWSRLVGGAVVIRMQGTDRRRDG